MNQLPYELLKEFSENSLKKILEGFLEESRRHYRMNAQKIFSGNLKVNCRRNF